LQEDLPIPLAQAFSLSRVFAADAGGPKRNSATRMAPRRADRNVSKLQAGRR
jgi:hypothetical protein